MKKSKFKVPRSLRFSLAVKTELNRGRDNPLNWSCHIKRDFPNEYRDKLYEYLSINS